VRSGLNLGRCGYIDTHLVVASESLLHEGFFLFQAIGVLLQGFDFLLAGSEHRGDLLVLINLLVEPLRLFHPALRCVE
jgi:hypothetical protein